jgi:hypothetical protein
MWNGDGGLGIMRLTMKQAARRRLQKQGGGKIDRRGVQKSARRADDDADVSEEQIAAEDAGRLITYLSDQVRFCKFCWL